MTAGTTALFHRSYGLIVRVELADKSLMALQHHGNARRREQPYCQSVRDLMAAMENGSLTMQQIAEAFAAMDDDELDQIGKLLRERHGKPMVPNRPKT
jgi:hypothetical protein